MTPEQRLKAFQQGLEQLQQRYGVNLVADSQVEKLGEAVLVKPMIRVVLADQWQPDDTTNN